MWRSRRITGVLRSGQRGSAGGVDGNGATGPDEASLRRPDGCQAEQGSIERVEAGRRDRDSAEAEREHRVLAVAGVVGDRARRLDRREVRLTAERGVQGPERFAGGPAARPSVLEPARADLSVRAAGDPPLGLVAAPGRSDVAKVAVVAEREAAGRVVERLGVGQLQGGELRGPPEVDEDARGLGCARRPLAAGSSRKARMSRWLASVASALSQAAPQPNPASPNRSSRSVNGQSSSIRNGSLARAT